MHLDNRRHIFIRAAQILLVLVIVVGAFAPIYSAHVYAVEGDTTVAADSTNNPPGDDFGFFRNAIALVVYIFTVGIGSFIARIAAFFLNFAIFFSLSSTPYALDFLTVAWEKVRDLANLGFIFILIYIAVTVTLKADTHNTMPMLARVIAIALIINFSFFFARVVIDAGNILAVNFYNNAQSMAQAPDLPTGGKDLTLPIMNMIGVTAPFEGNAFSDATKTSDWGQLLVMVFIYISMAVILGLLAAIFFTVGVKFIIRVVVLWITIIAAPLALLMYAIPGVAVNYQKQWLSALVTYSLFPAIFLFLYFNIIVSFAKSLTCQVTSGGTTTTVGNTILGCIQKGVGANPTGVFNDGANNILDTIGAVGFRLGFLIVLLYMTLLAANKLSSWGGEWAQKITERPERWLRTPANLVYRETVGRAADNLNKRLQTSRFANSALLNNPILGHPIKAIRENVLQPVAGSTLGAGLSRIDSKKQYDEGEKERKANQWVTKNRDDIKRLGDLEEKERKGTALSDPEKVERDRLADRASRFGTGDLEALKTADLERIVRVLKEDQVKKIKESKTISDATKEKIETTWNAESRHAPLKKANDQVVLLREINSKIGNVIPADKIGSEVKIDQTSIKDIKQILNNHMQDVDRLYEEARIHNDADEIARRGAERRLIRDGLDATKELDTHRKNVGPGIGGAPATGEFKAPKI